MIFFRDVGKRSLLVHGGVLAPLADIFKAKNETVHLFTETLNKARQAWVLGGENTIEVSVVPTSLTQCWSFSQDQCCHLANQTCSTDQ